MYLCKTYLTVHREYDLEDKLCDNSDVEKLYEVALCPKKNCSGKVVKVDELILPTIIELNKKGWKTSFCCSGHLHGEGNFISTYITFYDEPPSIPDSFVYEHKGIYHKTKKFNNSSRPNRLKRFEQLYQINKELYEWALSLPVKQ